MTTREYPEHVLLDGVSGQGQYVGTFIAWSQFSNGWWGGARSSSIWTATPTIPRLRYRHRGLFRRRMEFRRPDVLHALPGAIRSIAKSRLRLPLHGMYRWHIMDPIRFKQDLKVTVQALGWWLNRKFEPLTDDIASVAYWYQTSPHAPFPAMPPLAARWPRAKHLAKIAFGLCAKEWETSHRATMCSPGFNSHWQRKINRVQVRRCVRIGQVFREYGAPLAAMKYLTILV